MKKLSFMFFVIAFMIVSAFQVYAAETKIGIIDPQKILENSQKMLKHRSEFLKDVEAKKQELEKKQQAAQVLYSELRTKQGEMSDKEIRDKTYQLQREEKNLKRMQNEIEAELQAKNTELLRTFSIQISEVAAEYLKKEKLTLIMEKNKVIVSDDAVDITDQIIKLYDSKP